LAIKNANIAILEGEGNTRRLNSMQMGVLGERELSPNQTQFPVGKTLGSIYWSYTTLSEHAWSARTFSAYVAFGDSSTI